MRYVGSTQDLEQGWIDRRRALRKGKHHNIRLQRAWNKHGEENFIFEVEEEVVGDNKALLGQEQIYLDEGFELGILYNVARKAGGGNLGPEVNQKIRAGLVKYYETHDGPMKGKYHTEETKAQLSKANSGENHPMYGKKGKDCPNYGKSPSEETKAKIRKTLTGYKHTEETIIKKSGENHPLYGKYRSEETNLKIGKANAKPYPAFYNVETEEYISAGVNLRAICRDYGLIYLNMHNLKAQVNIRTKDGWQLADF